MLACKRCRLIQRQNVCNFLPGVHVLGRHDEDALLTHPVPGGRSLELRALEVEDPGARLAADQLALLVADPAVAVVGRILLLKDHSSLIARKGVLD